VEKLIVRGAIAESVGHNQHAMPLKKKSSQASATIAFIESMECLPVATLPEGEDWSYEIKLYRLATWVWTWNFPGENMR